MGRKSNQHTTVDLSIPVVVLQAAGTRIALKQAQERKANGRSATNMSTLAERILRNWEPGQTEPPPPPPTETAVCPHCGRTVKLYRNGKLRAHVRTVEKTIKDDQGKSRTVRVNAQCPEAFASKRQERAAQVKPLRFPMNRAAYEEIAARIHEAGQSVAGVVTQRLRDFAKTGDL